MTSEAVRTSKIALMHIPKTGGTALADQVYGQTRDDALFLFSFFGRDASQGKNRILVESLRTGNRQIQSLLQSRHFLESRVITGHFSYDLGRLLHQFSLQFAAALREPVDRCISLIYQFCSESPSGCRFGIYQLSSKTRRPGAFWDEIYWILKRHLGQPIPGLLPHESMMLYNGMCHMVGGTRLYKFSREVDYQRVLDNVPAFKFGLFERFNESCGALMRDLDLAVHLDEHSNPIGQEHPAGYLGHPEFYGAPRKLLDLVRSLNRDDLRLYQQVLEQYAQNL